MRRRAPRVRRRFLAALAFALGALSLRALARNADANAMAPAESVAVQPRTSPTAVPALMELLPAARDSARPTLYLIFSDDDCRARLDLLELLDRPAFTRSLARGGVLLLGTDSTAIALRRSLAAHRLAHPVRIAPKALTASLAALTRARTPIVLVTAPDGSLRYLAPAPATLDAEDLLARELAALFNPRLAIPVTGRPGALP